MLASYQRENQSLRVSNNGFCLVMRCQIVYDNPLLNDPAFLAYATTRSKAANLRNAILDAPSQIPQAKLCLYLEHRKYP